jgi:hypothetical protein
VPPHAAVIEKKNSTRIQRRIDPFLFGRRPLGLETYLSIAHHDRLPLEA